MLYWTIRTTILSIILILLVHHLINFFKSTLTVPKFKDLVNIPAQKYADIFNTINNIPNTTNILNTHNIPDTNSYESAEHSIKNNISSSSEINLLPNYEKDANHHMKNELKDFLKKQLNNDKVGNYTVMAADHGANYSSI